MNRLKIAGLTLVLGLFVQSVFAQFSISGTLKTPIGPVQYAQVAVVGTKMGANTDANGAYKIEGLKKGDYTLKVSHIEYQTQKKEVRIEDKNLVVDFVMRFEPILPEEVLLTALRAGSDVPTTSVTVDKEQLEKYNLGQDVPFLLRQTPSVVVTSDAGAGVGYTGIRVRGSDPTRVNVTINGVPLNDSEGQGVFWVNLPDFASSVENIQIQRGVGTSTNGAGAFGASLNIQTDKLRTEPYAEIANGYGSFNTLRHSVRVGTGLINQHWAVNARLSQITSDGFVDRASSNLRSAYLNAGYFGKKTVVKVNVMLGHERTYQSWYGTPESRVNDDVEGMNDYILNNGLDSSEAANLLNSNSRTYNYYTYQDEVDDYTQNHYQAILSHEINENLNVNATLHYTRGKGFFEQFRKGEALADYGLDDVAIGGDTVTSTDLIRRRWLDNHFYGVVYGVNYDNKKRLKLSLGGALNRYEGGHFGEVIWSEFASNGNIYDRYYDNVGNKNDFNVFLRGNYRVTEKLGLYADLQVRTIGYDFLGFDNNGNNVTQQVNLLFFNPKAGLTYQLAPNRSLYVSYARGSREPSRADYVESTPTSRPDPEFVNDIELGYRHMAKTYGFTANLYYMHYQNQLVLTGQVNDVGAYTRINIPTSFRAGLEIDGGVDIIEQLRLFANATISQNKIMNFSEFIFDYDTFTEQENQLGTTDIAFSPNVIAGLGLTWKPVKGLDLTWFSKYVGQQFLDNTSSPDRALDAYFVSDFKASYTFNFSWMKELKIDLLVNNVLNEKYESNGYTYGWLGGQRYDYNFLYPQAGINFLSGVTVKF